jgi:hypothetical protein
MLSQLHLCTASYWLSRKDCLSFCPCSLPCFFFVAISSYSEYGGSRFFRNAFKCLPAMVSRLKRHSSCGKFVGYNHARLNLWRKNKCSYLKGRFVCDLSRYKISHALLSFPPHNSSHPACSYWSLKNVNRTALMWSSVTFIHFSRWRCWANKHKSWQYSASDFISREESMPKINSNKNRQWNTKVQMWLCSDKQKLSSG